MINYIFLDIDGVLNDEEHIRQCFEKNGGYPMSMSHTPFDPRALTNLMYLVQHIRQLGNKPRIILSSSWRLNNIDTEIVKARIAEYGLRIDDKTPSLSSRGIEIYEFLQQNSGKEEFSFVILDDEQMDIRDYFPNNLVKVDSYFGLTARNIEEAEKILKERSCNYGLRN